MKKILVLTVLFSFLSVGVVFAKEGKKQSHCPICNMEVNKTLYADYDGKRVYFGCSGCPAEFKKNPEKYIKLLEDKGVVLEKTPMKDKKMQMKKGDKCCEGEKTSCDKNKKK